MKCHAVRATCREIQPFKYGWYALRYLAATLLTKTGLYNSRLRKQYALKNRHIEHYIRREDSGLDIMFTEGRDLHRFPPRRSDMIASVILNDMNRSRYSAYGFRSWMLQDIQEPYEVIINLFNNEAYRFESLCAGRNPACSTSIKTYAPPRFFNIAAANNIGLHFATGKYVVFALSDMIYTSSFLRVLIGELRRRQIFYALAHRMNLSRKQTRSLAPAVTYGPDRNFDFLASLPHQHVSDGSTPWTVVREVAEEVGGFDPQTSCHEDADFNDRVMHYLRRTGKQDCLYLAADLIGFHMYHEASELYDVSREAKAIVEPRRQRLLLDPASHEDIVPTNIRLLDALKNDIYATKPPPATMRSRLRKYPLITRIVKAVRILARG